MYQGRPTTTCRATGIPLFASTPVPLQNGCHLGRRLKQTLFHLLAGHSEKQAARAIGVTQHTFHCYVKQLYRRFGVYSRGELMARFIPDVDEALLLGLIEEGQLWRRRITVGQWMAFGLGLPLVSQTLPGLPFGGEFLSRPKPSRLDLIGSRNDARRMEALRKRASRIAREARRIADALKELENTTTSIRLGAGTTRDTDMRNVV